MIRFILSALIFVTGFAFAQTPFELQVADAIREDTLLPENASIRIVEMTPVRGRVETVDITSFEQRSGRFTATIAFGENRKPIQGQAVVSLPVVVARTTVQRNHVLERDDLELRFVSLSQVPASAFTAPEDLEGMSVRRSLAAGRPIKEDDVGRPIVMKKNATIEIVYERSGIFLQARGRSLQEGAMGDNIRIVAEGGNIVLGEVAGPSRVVVR